MRSATPQLSKKVVEDTGPLQKSLAKAIISMSPSRITAALVLSPKPSPSQKPAPTATTFFAEWRSQVALELITNLADELMGHHKDQNVGICCSLDHIWDSHLWG